MGGISSILYINVDKIFINLYLSVSDVGVYWGNYNYSLYNNGTTLSSIFVTVFFPVVIHVLRLRDAFNRINKIAILIITLGWPVIAGIGYVILEVIRRELSL